MNKLSGCLQAGVLAALFAGPAFAKDKPCVTPFLFETKPTFSLQDVARLGVGSKPIYDEDFVFWVDEFDDEDSPQRDGRLAIAIVFAGRHDIGEPVVGGVLWSRKLAKLSETRSDQMNKTGDGEFAVFALVDPKAACPNRNFVVHFDKKGALWADGKKVAQLPPE